MNPRTGRKKQKKYKDTWSAAVHGGRELQRRGTKFDANTAGSSTKVEERRSEKSHCLFQVTTEFRLLLT